MSKLAKIIEYLFYLFIFILPWQTRWIWHYGYLNTGDLIKGIPSQYLTQSLYAAEIVFGLFLILAIIYAAKTWQKKITASAVQLHLYLLSLIFLGLVFLSIIWAPDKITALIMAVKVGEGVLLFIIASQLALPWFKIGAAIIASGLFQAILGLWQFFSQQVVASKWLGMAEQISSNAGSFVVETDSMRWLRAYGTMAHPNILGGFLAVCLIILLIMLVVNKNKKIAWFLWASLPIISAGFLVAFSKSALIGLGVGWLLCFLCIFLGQDKRVKYLVGQYFLVIIMVAAILLMFYPEPFLARAQAQSRLEIKSQTERLQYFDQARLLISNNWYKGAGIGNYTPAVYETTAIAQDSRLFQPVHNVYILALSEIGIIGFIIFIWIILASLKMLYDYQPEEKDRLLKIFKFLKIRGHYQELQEQHYWFLGLAAVFLCWLSIMFFDHYLWTQYFGIMLWWLGLGLWVRQSSGEK